MNGGGQGARLPFFVVSVAAPPELPPAFPLRSFIRLHGFFSESAEFGGGPVPRLACVEVGLQELCGLRLSGVTGPSNSNLGYPHYFS